MSCEKCGAPYNGRFSPREVACLPGRAPDLSFVTPGANPAVAFSVKRGEVIWLCQSSRSVMPFGVQLVVTFIGGAVTTIACPASGNPVVFASEITNLGCDLPNIAQVRLDVWRDSATLAGREAIRDYPVRNLKRMGVG